MCGQAGQATGSLVLAQLVIQAELAGDAAQQVGGALQEAAVLHGKRVAGAAGLSSEGIPHLLAALLHGKVDRDHRGADGVGELTAGGGPMSTQRARMQLGTARSSSMGNSPARNGQVSPWNCRG